MTAEITTVIGQLSISNDKWYDDAPNQVAVRQPKSADAPGAGKGDLFIITEVQGDVDYLDILEQKLAERIRDTYYLANGSITASLRRAVQAGSDLLYKRNRKVSVDERVAGGAIVLAISGENVFVAQVGPAAFYAVLGDHIQRYPAQSVWLDEALGPEADQKVVALGLSKVIEPALHHLRILPDDMLVLADGRLAGQLPLKDVVKAVSDTHVKTAVKNLGEIAQASDCSAIVLEVVEKSAGNKGPIKISTPSQLSNLWPRKQQRSAGESSSSAPEPVAGDSSKAAGFAASASIMQKSVEWFSNLTHKSEAEPLADTAPFEDDDHRPYAKPIEQHEDDYEAHEPALEPEAEMSPYSYQMDSVAPGSVYRPKYKESSEETSGIKKILMGLVAAVLAVVALLGNGLKAMFGMLGGDSSPRQAGVQAEQSASSVPWKTLRNIAIAIPLLVILIVGISYLQKGRLQEAEYQEHLSTAQNKFEQAQAVASSAALGLMNEAEAELVKAEQIKPAQPEITGLREQMAVHTDSVGNVQRLYYLPQLRQYTDPGTNLNNIAVQGVEVYVMDTGNDRIFHHKLDDLGDALLPDDETVLMTAKGQTVDDISVGDLLAMTWMPTGGNRQTSDLVVLNSTGLLEFNPSWGITTAALAGGDLLKLPTAVDSYFGNLYILDPQANTLLRYLPTADGYSAAPESYFAADQTVDLSNAVDLAIDGAVFILYKDGRVEKFLGGQLDTFNITGLDVPLKNPTAIFTAPDEAVQHIYVADTGNQRVVQINKDGSFVQQFKPRPGEVVSFADLQDLYVDEIGSRLFVLDSNNLYLGKLPETSPSQLPGSPEAAPQPASPPVAEDPPQ